MRRALPLLLLALGVPVGGCGGSDDAEEGPRGAAAVGAPASALRAELSAALVARPWLTAASVRATLLDGAAAPTALAARRTLDAGTVELADRVAAAVGKEQEVLGLLRRQDVLWTQVALGLAVGDGTARGAADAGLAQNRRALASALASGELTARVLEEELAPAYASLREAVEAVAAGRAVAPRRTATAAMRALRPAPDLASAGKERRPQLVGDPASPAAELAALAATAFTDAAHAQYAADGFAATSAPTGPRASASGRVLEDTTLVTAQLVASVLGEDAGERWAVLWGGHTETLRAYATAKAQGDDVGAARALRALSRFRADTVALLAEVDPDGSPTGLTNALRDHVAATTATIRAQATGSPKAAPRQLEAAEASRAVGNALARRFAARFPEKFPAG